MFDRATFYLTARKSTMFDGTLSTRQVQGTEAILNAWDKSGYTDERWLAYALGTAYHETARAMFPVPEGGRGKGHPYGKPGPDGQVAYGRGFVQLTWPENYARADKELGLGGKLTANYDLALDPAISAQVLLRGMAEAWFTKFKLADYLNDHLADYLHARRIVNGMDQADKIASYALIFFGAIQAAEHKAADHSAVVPVPSPRGGDLPGQIGQKDKQNQSGEVMTNPAGPSPDPLTSALSGLTDVISTAVDTIGSAVVPASPPAGPSPGAAASSPATDTTGPDIMKILTILTGLFGGVAGKIGVASSVVSAVPSIVEGTMANLGEAPKAIADIEKLIADVKAGKWTDAPADVHALLAEFGVILTNYGVNLPGLTGMVAALPSTPAIPAAAPGAKTA